jgi:hypothetical protein
MSMNIFPASRRFRFTLIVLASLTVMEVAHSQTTNSWIAPSNGKWERVNRWDDGLPSVTQSAVIISNATSKVVTINARTARKFPNSLVISNLTVSAPDGVNNTLFLHNTGTIALHILNALTIGLIPDGSPGGGAELISAGSTLTVDGLLGGQLQDNGTLVITGGSLITTNCSLLVASSSLSFSPSVGLLIISNAQVQARDITITSSSSESLSSGRIEVVGGRMTLTSFLAVGNGFENSQGSFFVANGGLLVVTNNETDIGGSYESSGILTVSNANFFANDIFLGGTRSAGALAINDGTVTLGGQLGIGDAEQGSGSVSLDGGKLVVTNGETRLGLGTPSDGRLAVSDGLFLARDVYIGAFESSGTLFIDGGTSILSSNLQIGSENSDVTVSMTGGRLFVTNAPIVIDDEAQCIVSGGHVAARTIELGRFAVGTLVVDGGSVTASEGITLGDCNDVNVAGYVSVDRGRLTVTNAGGTGFIDVRNGQLTLDGGTLYVDKLVMTNTCSSLVHTGGPLIVGSVVLDPDAFGITSVAREGDNLRITWMMGPGQINALQAAFVRTHGHHTTNYFADIFIVTNNTTPGVVTNYLDIGAATNVPPRSYRAWLVP